MSCAAGTTNIAGDDASGQHTPCDATLCSVNEHVASNACVPCDPGSINTAGDDASGMDTACDPDSDDDGLADAIDNCPVDPNPLQEDLDMDGTGDVCDPDQDGDGVENAADNCPLAANPGQLDTDMDGRGDACEAQLIPILGRATTGLLVVILVAAGFVLLYRSRRIA